jgi:GAF domain-containing protein
MSESIYYPGNGTRQEKYEALLPQIEALVTGEPDLIANLANVSAVLKDAFGWHWVGFYLEKGGELVLGPFQGPLACSRIAFGKGVCGTAAQKRKTVIVPDVDLFPGHIACSSLTRSEIVVPLVIQDKTCFVLDVDSLLPDDFTEADQIHLERIVSLFSSMCSVNLLDMYNSTE